MFLEMPVNIIDFLPFGKTIYGSHQPTTNRKEWERKSCRLVIIVWAEIVKDEEQPREEKPVIELSVFYFFFSSSSSSSSSFFFFFFLFILWFLYVILVFPEFPQCNNIKKLLFPLPFMTG
jgi:hypothetical protein